MISKVHLNSRSDLRKRKNKEPNISDPCEAQEKYKMLKHSNDITTVQYQQWTKGQLQWHRKKVKSFLYPCKIDTKVVKPMFIFLHYWRHDWVIIINTQRKVQTVSFQCSIFPSLIWHFVLYTSMKIWNKKNFSQTPLPPPALLDSLKLHFYFLGLQLLFPSDF